MPGDDDERAVLKTTLLCVIAFVLGAAVMGSSAHAQSPPFIVIEHGHLCVFLSPIGIAVVPKVVFNLERDLWYGCGQ